METDLTPPVTPVGRFISKERRLSETSDGTALTFLSPGTASGTPMTASMALDPVGLVSYASTDLVWEGNECGSQLPVEILSQSEGMLDQDDDACEHRTRTDSLDETSSKMTCGFLQFSPSLIMENLGVVEVDSDEEGSGNSNSWDSSKDALARFGLHALEPLEEDSLVAFVNTINALTRDENALDDVSEASSSLGKAQSSHSPKTRRKGSHVAVSEPETNPLALEVIQEVQEQEHIRSTTVPPSRAPTRTGLRILSSRMNRVTVDAPGLNRITPNIPDATTVQDTSDQIPTNNDINRLPNDPELGAIPETGDDDNHGAAPRAERKNSLTFKWGKGVDTSKQEENLHVPKADNPVETTKQKPAMVAGRHKSSKEQANAKTGKKVGGLFKKVFSNHMQSDFEADLIDAVENRPYTKALRAAHAEEAIRYGTLTEASNGASHILHDGQDADSVPRTMSLQASSTSLLPMQSGDQSVQRSRSLNSATVQQSVRVSQPRSLLSGRSSAVSTSKSSTRPSNPKYGKRSLDVVDRNTVASADDLVSLPSVSQSLPSLQSSVSYSQSIQSSLMHTPSIQSTIRHAPSIRSSATNTPFISPRTGRSRMMAPE